MRAFKVYCQSKFQIYSTVLLTNINILVTMLTALNLILIRYISISSPKMKIQLVYWAEIANI